MQFTLSVDLDQLDSTGAELSRILRYWADALDDEDLANQRGMNIYDSRYTKVGRWEVRREAQPVH